jgi:hypothetical protein
MANNDPLSELESVLHLLSPAELAEAEALLTPTLRDLLGSMPLQAVELLDAAHEAAGGGDLPADGLLPLLPESFRDHFRAAFATMRWSGPVDGPWPEGTTLGRYEYYQGEERRLAPRPPAGFAAEYAALRDWLRQNRHRIDPAPGERWAGHSDPHQLAAWMPDDPRSPFAPKYAEAVRALKARYAGVPGP